MLADRPILTQEQLDKSPYPYTRLDPVRASDLGLLRLMRNHGVREGRLEGDIVTRQQQRDWFATGPEVYLVLNFQQDVVGYLNVQTSENGWRWHTIYTRPEHRGQGYGTSAMAHFHDMHSMIRHGNGASYTAHRRAGFEDDFSFSIPGWWFLYRS